MDNEGANRWNRDQKIDGLVTPSLLLDRGKLERNINRLADHAKKAGRGVAPAHEDGQEH